LLTPLAFVVAEERAIRQSGVACFGTSVIPWDIYPADGGMHDWGAVSKWAPQNSTLDTNTIYCPVPLDVPRFEGNGIQQVRILYATRERNIATQSMGNFTPEIKSCAVYLMDGSEEGIWYKQTETVPAGGNTGSLFNDGWITFTNATAPLGSTKLRRMLITCQMPRSITPSGGQSGYWTAILKATEVQYLTSSAPGSVTDAGVP
jgi:hypothetical protein